MCVQIMTCSLITANDVPCEMYGKGSILLKNDDGSFRIPNDVRYVPTWEKNIIFVGSLEAKGFEPRISERSTFLKTWTIAE